MGDEPGNADPLAALTPGERRVFDYVREGVLDAEIAVRLGSSNAEVKNRIANILRALDLPDRAAIKTWAPATWTPRTAAEPEAAAPGEAPRQAFRGAPAVLAGLLLVAGLAASAAFALRGGPEQEQATTATGTAPPGDVSAAVEPQVIRFGRDFDLQNYSIIVETGCAGCGDGPSGVVRVSRFGTGKPEVEPLFQNPLDGPITSVASDRDGWRLAVTVCAAGDCTGGDTVPAGTQTALFLSDDGGVTWRQATRISGDVRATLFDASGLLLGVTSPGATRQPDGGPAGYRLYPAFLSPAGWQPGDRPVGVLEQGRIAWARGDLLYTRVGDPVPLPPLGAKARIISVEPLGDDGRIVLTWSDESVLPPRTYTGVVTALGEFESLISGAPAWSVVRLTDDLVLQTSGLPSAYVPGEPAGEIVSTPIVFDLSTGELRPTPNAFTLDPAYRNGRNIIRAYRRGPFVQVVAPLGGTCAPVRAQPSDTATLRACFAPGVLIKESAPPHTIGGFRANQTTWIQVTWPGGEGWIASDSLAWHS